MGLTLLTALTIKENAVRCDAGGPATTNGKYAGWIMMDVDRWQPLLNTEPVYETAALAKKAMEEIVSTIKNTDFSREVKELEKIL